MPIVPPSLDDRSFDDLVSEVLDRIPAHTPEWTHPRPGDPGRTLVELFAWLFDSILYRANLIPERQRLAFLRLLGEPMRPAAAATGLVSVQIDEDEVSDSVTLDRLATLKGPVDFETRSVTTVLPVTAECYYKRPLDAAGDPALRQLVAGLKQIYEIDKQPIAYATTPVFPGGGADPSGFDLIADSVDKALWVALLAPSADLTGAVRQTLGGTRDQPRQLLSLGISPAVELPRALEALPRRARVPHVWEITTGGRPAYLELELVEDSTEGLTRPGVARLALPGRTSIGAPSNDVRNNLKAGVGDSPPRLDDADRAARLVAWLRLRPTRRLQSLSLSWVGANAVEIDQRSSVFGRVVGQSDGSPDQIHPLPGRSVEESSLVLQVEEGAAGYLPWRAVGDLATTGRDDRVFRLDSEAGTVSFGDGVRGRVPEQGARIRAAVLRAGGGRAGNLPPGTLTAITARDLQGVRVARKLKVSQPLATGGGADAESLAEAERRIPARLRHRNRSVTRSDYQHLAAETPGADLGRVEVLPRFKPHQRRSNVPGVVSVMVWPRQQQRRSPNPRPDRPFIERVHAYLDERRPLATELYVISCEYIPLALTAGVGVREGFAPEKVTVAVRQALHDYLWSLAPGGPDTGGWPLGRPVREGELEVVVGRVRGVDTVNGVRLFSAGSAADSTWKPVSAAASDTPPELTLDPWQLPELQAVIVSSGGPPAGLDGLPDPYADEAGRGVGVPIVPDVCSAEHAH